MDIPFNINFQVYILKLLSYFFLALSLFFGVVSADEILRDTTNGAVVINQPIDLNMNIMGVKAESIYFGEKEALVILWNRTPTSVKAYLGLALFDSAGKIMGTGTIRIKNVLNLGGIRSGKQKSYRLNYDKFINNIENVSSYQLVFSVVPSSEEVSAF
ncbi:MAG: hypothetical protein V3V09_05700 [Arenicellales bacterium]